MGAGAPREPVGRSARAGWALLLWLFPSGAAAAEGAGTLEDPVRIDVFPYAHAADTTGRGATLDTYGCAPTLDEGGPEVVYRFELPAAATVTAWLEGDRSGVVDIDVHLLADPAAAGGSVPCLARGNLWAEADLPAGPGWVVVDTYVSGGRPLPGPYVLRVDARFADTERVREVARGVVWRQRRHADLAGGVQTVTVLEVDPAASGVDLRPVDAEGCETVAAMGARVGAVAGVNAGFFDGVCGPVGLVRIDGRLVAPNPTDRPPRSVLGLADDGPRLERIAGGADWPAVRQALGGLPQLVRDGVPAVLWAEEAAGESFAVSRHPRTAACITTAGTLLFLSVDGRTAAGLGLSLAALADLMIDLGCRHALNYDGGGSTTLWVAGQAADGVVNYPSDNGVADHLGSRAVANGWFVHAEPIDHPPRFTTTPPLDARAGIPWRYDADAIDLDLQPLRFSRGDGPDGLTVDPLTGEATWTPGYRDGGDHPVSLRVDDGTQQTEQPFVVRVTVADGDGDTLPDGWETEEGTDLGRDDAAEDPDGDGWDNRAEFAAGTDPLDPADHPGGGDGDAGGDGASDGGDAGGEEDGGGGGGWVDDGGCTCGAAGGAGGAGGWVVCGIVLAGMRRRAGRRRGGEGRQRCADGC